jgi:hypothetical protein
MVSARLQMADHGVAHDAKPDPGDFAHVPSSTHAIVIARFREHDT